MRVIYAALCAALLVLPAFAQRISDLPAASTVTPGDLMAIVQAGVTKRAAAGLLLYTLPPASASTRGGVTVASGLSLAGDALSVVYGTGPGTAAQGDDSRIVGALSAAAAATTYAPKNSPDLAGTPTAPTPASSDNSTRVATTAWGRGLFASPPALGTVTPAPVTATALTVQGASNALAGSGSAAGVAVRLYANGADANIPIAIIPKGSGALLAGLPDGTAAGGNARGAGAVDWQTTRTAAGQVASGLNSTIPGGSGNTASGAYTLVAGQNSTAIGQGSAVLGVAGTDRGTPGALVWAGGQFAMAGDAQSRVMLIRGATSSTTATRLTSDGGSVTATNIIKIPNNSAYAVTIELIGRDTTAPGNSVAWRMPVGVFEAGASGATVTWTGGTPTVASNGTGSAATVSVTAATGSASLAVNVTAPNTNAWRWVARVQTTEVQ